MGREVLAVPDGSLIKTGDQCGQRTGGIAVSREPAAVVIHRVGIVSDHLDDVASPCWPLCPLECAKDAVDLGGERLRLRQNPIVGVEEPIALIRDPDLVTEIMPSAGSVSDPHELSKPAF